MRATPQPSGMFQLTAPCWTVLTADGEGAGFEGSAWHYETEDEARKALPGYQDEIGSRALVVTEESGACWKALAVCGTEYVYDENQSHFGSKTNLRDCLEDDRNGWQIHTDGSVTCDNETCGPCRPDTDPLLVPVPMVDGQQPLGWPDRVTGLVSGPIVESDYPLRCQHCTKDIRPITGGYEDPTGFTTCRKDLFHKPMPAVADA